MATKNEEWLVVLNSERAVATQSTLVFEAVQPMAIAFTDRPERRVRRLTVASLVAAWNDLYGDQPPNAALAWLADDGEKTAVVELGQPTASDGGFGFPSRWLESPSSDGAGPAVAMGPPQGQLVDVSLFIDSAGPLGFGGATSDFTILRQEQNQL